MKLIEIRNLAAVVYGDSDGFDTGFCPNVALALEARGLRREFSAFNNTEAVPNFAAAAARLRGIDGGFTLLGSILKEAAERIGVDKEKAKTKVPEAEEWGLGTEDPKEEIPITI